MTLNPYKPSSTGLGVRPDHFGHGSALRRATTLYQWMGWVGILYFAVAFPLGLWSEGRNPPLRVGTLIGMTVMTLLFVGLFSMMIRLAPRLQSDLASVYVRARWTGLLVGAFGFPFLTIPAFYAVRIIGRAHRNSQASDEPADGRESPS